MRGLVLVLALVLGFKTAFASVVFKPEKEIYKKGEKICFYIKNESNKTIYLPSSAPWVVFQEEKVLYAPVATQSIVKLKPNETKKWCWKQNSFNDEEIVSGEYTIRLTVFEDGKRKFLSFKVKVQPKYSDAK